MKEKKQTHPPTCQIVHDKIKNVDRKAKKYLEMGRFLCGEK